MSLLSKKNVRASELNSVFYKSILENNYQNFEIIPDNVQMFYISSNEFFLTDDNNDNIFHQQEPIELELIVEKTKYVGGDVSSVKKVFEKFKLCTKDSNGDYLLFPSRLLDLIRGFIEKDDETYYLINGEWYVFEKDYYGLLDKKYSELFDSYKQTGDKLVEKYNLIRDKKNENDYNNSFEKENEIILAHPKTIRNVEIADLIFFDDNNLYLMCNKGKFSGSAIRDLSNQIETSAKIISNNLQNSKFIEDYYNKLLNSQKAKISSEEFVKNFLAKKIVYIAGFSCNFKKKTNSVYCKYLIIELYKNLSFNNFKLIVVNYNE